MHYGVTKSVRRCKHISTAQHSTAQHNTTQRRPIANSSQMCAIHLTTLYVRTLHISIILIRNNYSHNNFAKRVINLGSTSATGIPFRRAMSSTVSLPWDIIPTHLAIALAVIGWSPVTIITCTLWSMWLPSHYELSNMITLEILPFAI